MPVLACLIICAGCIEVISPTAQEPENVPPVPYIDSISSNRVFQGETVTFSGHGVDPDGDSIVGYRWRSSLDGIVSTQASFESDSLSPGKNTIYFSVQDSVGDWSKEIYRDITVIPPGSMVPILHDFYALPTSVIEGEPATLYWDVSGADTVTISPDIGCVALKGSRAIYPPPNNVYRLEAVNDAGTTEGRVRIIINPSPARSKTVYAIVEECGFVDNNGKIGKAPRAGDTSNGVSMQAFLSFDISSIPTDATVTEATLDLSQTIMQGNPFGVLGGMGVFNHQYDTLNKNDFVRNNAFSSVSNYRQLIVAYVKPGLPYSNDILRYAVQNQIDDRESRFRIRVQFEKMIFYNQLADYIEFVPDKVRLTVKYN